MIATKPFDCVQKLFLGQKAMVTGASGFLGSHLCHRLGENGAEIHAISRSQRSVQSDRLRWWKGDLADITSVRTLVHQIRPDVIFHCSGLVTAARDLELVLPTFHSLLLSTVNILTAAAETGCRRIVLIGSFNEPKSKDDPPPDSPYAAAKWASSVYGQMFSELYAMPVVTVRTCMTFGPGQDSTKLIPHVTLSLLRGEAPRLSSGRWEADWIYIDDVIDGVIKAGHVPDVGGCTFDLGSGTLLSIRAIVEHLVRVMGSRITPLFGALPDRLFERKRPAADVAYTYAKLGWKPTTSLTSGLENTVSWYRQHAQERLK
jgi:nucleoside-diphosphate-sugar epimerase